MISRHSTTDDLARAVSSHIRRKSRNPPALPILNELLSTLFEASLKSEEGQPINCHVAFVDPQDPDPDPPTVIVRDRWISIPLRIPVRFSVENITKVSKASDPRTSSLAVFPNADGEIAIWGLIDQGNLYFQYTNLDSDSGVSRPGLFQIIIAGLGHLIAYDELTKIAELRVTELVTTASDAIWKGAIRKHLEPVIASVHKGVRSEVGDEAYELRNHWDESIADLVLKSICRLLLRTQGHRHGGAFLFNPSGSTAYLRVKHAISYERLPTALTNLAISQIREVNASDEIAENYVDTNANEIPVGLYLDEAVGHIDVKESESEINGVIWFMSLLTRLDGLVLLGPRLEVLGFGVEINCADEPSRVFRASDAHGSRLKELDYQHFGTRHRSMMRYCAKVPGSLGFVISQDGDVRGITGVDDKLVVFENLRLQATKFARKRNRLDTKRERLSNLSLESVKPSQ